MAADPLSTDDRGADRPEGTSEQAQQKAKETAHEAQQKAGAFADKARQQAETQFAGQKDQVTGQLSGISSALRQTSANLQDEDQEAVAGYVDRAAQQVDGLTDYLQTRTVGELVGEAERYARREPALFLGGAALLGLVGARFFRSSSPDNGQSAGTRSGYDRDYRGRPTSGGDYREPAYQSTPHEGHGRSRDRRGSGEGDYSEVHGTSGTEMPDASDTGRTARSRADTELEETNTER